MSSLGPFQPVGSCGSSGVTVLVSFECGRQSYHRYHPKLILLSNTLRFPRKALVRMLLSLELRSDSSRCLRLVDASDKVFEFMRALMKSSRVFQRRRFTESLQCTHEGKYGLRQFGVWAAFDLSTTVGQGIHRSIGSAGSSQVRRAALATSQKSHVGAELCILHTVQAGPGNVTKERQTASECHSLHNGAAPARVLLVIKLRAYNIHRVFPRWWRSA